MFFELNLLDVDGSQVWKTQILEGRVMFALLCSFEEELRYFVCAFCLATQQPVLSLVETSTVYGKQLQPTRGSRVWHYEASSVRQKIFRRGRPAS
jgi:hypothetical protein